MDTARDASPEILWILEDLDLRQPHTINNFKLSEIALRYRYVLHRAPQAREIFGAPMLLYTENCQKYLIFYCLPTLNPKFSAAARPIP